MTTSGRLAPPPAEAAAAPNGKWPAAFGPRFFLFLTIGALWILPAWWNPRFLTALAAWDLLALAVWGADLARLPPPRSLRARRRWEAPLELAAPSRVEIEIDVTEGIPVIAVLTDEMPESFRAGLPAIVARAAPGAPGRGSYEVRPGERGDVETGRLYIRYQSRLRFAERRAVADLRQKVTVYPAFDAWRAHTFYLMRTRQVEQERRLRRQRGLGREFESLREYREGDPWRDICWNATARRGRLVSKEYRVERNQSVWLLLDAGRLLRARTGGLAKLDHAAEAALALGGVALRAGDSVGLLAYGRRTQQRLGAGRGASHLRALAECLAHVRAEATEADHTAATQWLLGAQQRRSLVVWLTDLAETATVPEVIECAAQAMRRHLVLFVAIGQPELQQLMGRTPESASEMYRYVSALEMAERRELLLRRLRQRGALVADVPPGGLSTALVNRYLEVKDRGML